MEDVDVNSLIASKEVDVSDLIATPEKKNSSQQTTTSASSSVPATQQSEPSQTNGLPPITLGEESLQQGVTKQDVTKPVEQELDVETHLQKIQKLRSKQLESKVAVSNAEKAGDIEAASKAIDEGKSAGEKADKLSEEYAKAYGYNGTKLGYFDTFLNSATNTVNSIDFGVKYMHSTPENQAKMLKDNYDKQQQVSNVLQPKEGFWGGAAQIAGSVAPFVATGLATGGAGDLPALVAGAATFGLSELGSKAQEGYNKAKAQGLSDEEALKIAHTDAMSGGAMGVLAGGSLHGIDSKEIPQSFMDWMGKSAKKNATIGGIFSAMQLAQNGVNKAQGLDVQPLEGVVEKGVEGAMIGIAMDGLHKMGSSMTEEAKNKIQDFVAYTNPEAAIMGVNKAKDAGILNPLEANTLIQPIIQKSDIFKQLPDVPLEKATEVAPHVDRINQLTKQLEVATPALKPNIEDAIVRETRDLHEKLGTPLTIDEEKKLEKLNDIAKDEVKKLKPSEIEERNHLRKRKTASDKEFEKQQADGQNIENSNGQGETTPATPETETTGEQVGEGGKEESVLPNVEKPVSEKINTEPSFRTMDMGKDEGAPETKEARAQMKERFAEGNTPVDGDKGETGRQFAGRVLTKWNEVKDNEAHNTTVTTHSSVLKAIKAFEDESTWKDVEKPKDPSNMTDEQWKAYSDSYIKESTNNGDLETFKGKNGEINVIRHGQTEDNKQSKFRSGNTPLTDKGIEQAHEVGKQLKDKTGGDVPKIISSDLPRAVHTSNLIHEELQPKEHQHPIKEKPYTSKNGKAIVYSSPKTGEIIIESKDGKEITDSQRKSLTREYKDNYKYDTGKDFSGEAQSINQVIDETNNPAELAVIMEGEPKYVPEDELDHKERAIANNIGHVKRDSYVQHGDENNISMGVAKEYLRKDGQPLDLIAMEASREAYGDYDAENPQITEQDVIDFIHKYPSKEKFWKQKSETFEKARNRFRELTGFEPDEKTIKLASDEYHNRKESVSSNQEGNGTTTPKVEGGIEQKASETLPEGKVAGISNRIMADIEKRLGITAPESGEGIDPANVLPLGRAMIKEGADANKLMDDFENGAGVTPEGVALIRAKAEELTKAADDAKEKFGISSKEFNDASKALQEWQDRIKPYATKASNVFKSYQGATDVDTGSFISLRSAWEEKAGREPNENELKQIEELSNKVKDGEKKYQDALDEISRLHDEAAKKAEPKSYTKKAKEVADTFRKLKTKPFVFKDSSGNEIAVHTMGITWNDAVELGAKAIEKTGEIADGVKAAIDHIKDSDWYKNFSEEDKKKFEQQLNEHYKEENIQQSDIHTKYIDKKGNDFTPQEAKEIWDYAKENYLSKGKSPQDMIRGVSTDLGLTYDQVNSAIATPKTSRNITNDMYLQYRNNRKAIQSAKDFVEKAGEGKVDKTMSALERAWEVPRNLLTAGHGTVAPITHSGLTLFNPLIAKQNINFILHSYNSAYGAALKKGGLAKFEQRVSDFKNDPAYADALKHGVDVDASKSDNDYAPAKHIIGILGQIGDRGFFELKPYRLELYKKALDGVSEVVKSDPTAYSETKKMLAGMINNATGVGSKTISDKIPAKLVFAPKLVASQVGRLIAEPLEAAKVLGKIALGEAKPSEKAAMKIYAAHTIAMVGGYAAALALNQGYLSAIGSNHKVNMTNPDEPDFLRMKSGDGRTVAPDGGVVSMFRFLKHIKNVPFMTPKEAEGSRIHKLGGIVLDELRGKAHPSLGIAFDFISGKDFDKNIVPTSSDKPKFNKFTGKMAHKMTWREYALKHLTPIPAQEAMRGEEHTTGDILSGLISGITGAKVGDKEKEIKDNPKPPSKSKRKDLIK